MIISQSVRRDSCDKKRCCVTFLFIILDFLQEMLEHKHCSKERFVPLAKLK